MESKFISANPLNDNIHNFDEKWIHITFFFLISPLIWALTKYITPSELIILTTFSVVLCGYFHVLFHHKIGCVNHVQIQVLTSISEMLRDKLLSNKVIYLSQEEDMEEDSCLYQSKYNL